MTLRWDPVNLRVYVGELDPTKVWRFDMKADDGTGGRGNIIHSGTTPSSSGTTINATFVDTQETNKKSLTQEEEIMPAIIIGALLVIPIIIIIVIVIVIRIYKKEQKSAHHSVNPAERIQANTIVADDIDHGPGRNLTLVTSSLHTEDSTD